MKKLLFLSFIVATFFLSCDNNTQTTTTNGNADTSGISQQIQQLNANLKKLEVPSQMFYVGADKLSMVVGKKGTVLFIAPEDLETEAGMRPEKNIAVELKELTDQEDLLRTNAQTISNGNLLASGGAYFVNMSSGGKQLRLKKGRTLKVALPKFSDSTMSLFYGQRDSMDQMNWQPTDQQLTSKNGYNIDTGDTKSIMVYDDRNYKILGYVGNDSTYRRDTAMLGRIKKKEVAIREADQKRRDSVRAINQAISNKLNRKLYDISTMTQLGWINVDKFEKSKMANMTYTIDPKDSIVYARIYVVFRDINSATAYTFDIRYGETSTRYFGSLPVDYKVRIIAVAYKKNQLVTSNMDITIAKDQHTLLQFKPTTTEELNELFKTNSSK